MPVIKRYPNRKLYDTEAKQYITLDEIGYQGPLTIEREIPQEPDRQKQEISRAVGLLTELKAKLGKSASE